MSTREPEFGNEQFQLQIKLYRSVMLLHIIYLTTERKQTFRTKMQVMELEEADVDDRPDGSCCSCRCAWPRDRPQGVGENRSGEGSDN